MPEEYNDLSQIKGVPQLILQRVPPIGLLFFSFSRYDANGIMALDLDENNLVYELYFPRDQNKLVEGEAQLPPDEMEQIKTLFEIIWNSTSNFPGDFPAKIMGTDLVLAQNGKYRHWHLPGMFAGEAGELHELLIGLIKND